MICMYMALINDQNDREKFIELYDHYKNAAIIIAMRLLNNRTLAEDAVQEAFFRIADNISKVEGISPKTTSYINIVIRNVCFDILRKEKKNDTLPLDDNILSEKNIELPDIQIILQNSGIKFIAECINSMDIIYRDAISLKYVYGYSVEEIAKSLGINEKTVEMRLYRGRKILKKILEENGYAVEQQSE